MIGNKSFMKKKLWKKKRWSNSL